MTWKNKKTAIFKKRLNCFHKTNEIFKNFDIFQFTPFIQKINDFLLTSAKI